MDTLAGLTILLLVSMGWAYWKMTRDDTKALAKPVTYTATHQTQAKPSSKVESASPKKHHGVISHHERPARRRGESA